jgi:hypothetical protein
MADELEAGGPSCESNPGEEAERGDLHYFPIRILTVAERRAADPAADADLLKLAKSRAPDPTIFDEFPPVFIPTVVSTNKLDSYFTLMHRSSLENFAADLSEGRSLLDSHNSRRLGIGYSLRGQYVAAGGNGVQKALGDFFSTEATADSREFILKMRQGTVKDISAGFYGGEWRCNLCGQKMADWWAEDGCFHWPGMTYETEKSSEKQLATATIHDAHLAEASAVYDGATPGAMILRARQMSEAGRIVPEMARRLETQYRIQLPAAHRAWAGHSSGKERAMPEKPEGQSAPPVETPGDVGVLQAFHRSVASALTDVGLKPEPGSPEPATLIRQMGAELVELRPLKDKVATQETRIAELTPQAEDGKQFRADLRQAVEERYVAAKGERANPELMAEVWDRASIPLLKQQYLEYAGEAYSLFGGGRTSQDQGEPKPNGEPPAASPVPLHLYAA